MGQANEGKMKAQSTEKENESLASHRKRLRQANETKMQGKWKPRAQERKMKAQSHTGRG